MVRPVWLKRSLPLVLPGELFVVDWLFVKGGKVPLAEARPSDY